MEQRLRVSTGMDEQQGEEEEELHEYEYVRLVDALVALDQKVNFYGVVTEYDSPKPTNGKDLLCTMAVSDMSCNSPGLRVLAFGSRSSQLPIVKSIGDIIRFHRVKMNIHNKSPQALALKGSAFVLFQGHGSSYEPYQTSSRGFTFEERDRKILDLIRAWNSTHAIIPVSTDYLLAIRSITREGLFFDLCCKVLFLSNEQHPSPTVILYVWDGSDAPLATSLPFEEGRSVLPLSVLRTFPSKGTVLQVIVDVPTEEHGRFWLPQAGSWLKLRNITSTVSGTGILQAVFTRESKFSMLPSDSQLVKDAQRWYEHRLSEAQAGLPEACTKPIESLTVTDYEHVPFSTLREVLTFPQVTYKFRCLVRVRSIWPSQVADLCGCLEGEYAYRVQLTLEDPTAQIHAYLYRQDGARFFNGYSPARRDPDDACLGAQERAVNRLLGAPWVKCCIESYYLDKEQPWSSRRFRIFGTRLP